MQTFQWVELPWIFMDIHTPSQFTLKKGTGAMDARESTCSPIFFQLISPKLMGFVWTCSLLLLQLWVCMREKNWGCTGWKDYPSYMAYFISHLNKDFAFTTKHGFHGSCQLFRWSFLSVLNKITSFSLKRPDKNFPTEGRRKQPYQQQSPTCFCFFCCWVDPFFSGLRRQHVVSIGWFKDLYIQLSHGQNLLTFHYTVFLITILIQ